MTLRPLTLLDLLEIPLAQTPRASAVTTPGAASLSYEGLRALVHRTAASLSAFGFGREDRIAIVLPNGPEMATCFFSVAASFVAAPLNPAYRLAEFEFSLGDLRARALIVEKGASSPAIEAARAQGVRILELQKDPKTAGDFHLCSATSPSSGTSSTRARPNDAALILHTSGTTSRPKIVPLSQKNLCASAMNIANTLRLSPTDRCLNIMPLFHIHGLVATVVASLASGASVSCTPGFQADRFFHGLVEESATWYTAVPTIHQAILDAATRSPAPLGAHRLRFVRSSSASLPPRVMHELASVFGVPVIEAYGMTEAAHQIASNPLPPGRQIPGSVGLPSGVQVALLDEASKPVPIGQAGEIAIMGPNVTSAYEANPAANETAFVDGFFRTGDIGRLDAEGYLYITGRIKDIINRGGEKISPGEVDAALLEQPDVQQAVAFGVPHPTFGEDIAAAVVLSRGARSTEKNLRDFLSRRLASFKVPYRILLVEEIPKGATGKLKRRDLVDLFADQLTSRSAPPRTPTEKCLASLFANVLGIENIGIRDNFTALGGDSLRATSIAAMAQEAGLSLEPQMLFDHPTIEELARILAPE